MKKVQKSLSPEEKSVIANVKSLLDQLESIEAGEGEMEDGTGEMPVEMAAMTDGLPAGDEEQEDLEEDKIEKDETANSKADQRIGELPVDDEEALSVLKSLMGIGGVQKSARVRPAQSDQTMLILGKIAKSLNIIADRQDQQGSAIVGILEGIGISDEAMGIVRKSRPNPKQNSAQDVVALLRDALRVEKSATAPEAPGTMKDALGALWH